MHGVTGLRACSVLRRATTFLVVAGEWVTFGKAPTLGGLVSRCLRVSS